MKAGISARVGHLMSRLPHNMPQNRQTLIALATLMLAGILGWFLLQEAANSGSDHESSIPKKKYTPPVDTPLPSDHLGERHRTGEPLTRDDLISMRNERIVTFASEAAYRRGLKRLKNSKFDHMGSLDDFFAIRIGYNKLSDLKEWLGEDGELHHNYHARIPTVPDVEEQPDAVGFGADALEFLGVDRNNTEWGRDVTVAVLDTGVSEHITLGETLPQINITTLPDGVEQHGHGTAVAGPIAGKDRRLLGVAPAATLAPIRIADETGLSNSYYIAEGIMAALDLGADIINISMGGEGDSVIVQRAIQEATARGVAIVASSGNDGFDTPYYPAANEGVYSVGGFDARGLHLNFSNRGDNLSLSAPGLAVNAPWPGDRVIEFSGTSASGPFVSGAIAALISESQGALNGVEAAQILLDYSNDAGLGGHDSEYGYGQLNIGRAIDRNEPNIDDLAVASHHYFFEDDGTNSPGLQINVENRGTTTSYGSQLHINVAGSTYDLNVNQLSPAERKSFFVPTGLSELQNQGQLNVNSFIRSTANTVDHNGSNNERFDRIYAPNSDK